MFNTLSKKQWMWSVKSVAWKVAAVLLLVAWYSNTNSTGSMLTALTTLTNTMQPTMNYYDTNQAAAAISGVSWLAAGTACPVGWVQQTELFQWPGTTASSGQAATTSVNLASWRGASFCTLAQAATDTQQSTTGTCVAGSTFPDQCDACNCAATGKCPVTQFSVVASTATTPATPWKQCTSTDTKIPGVPATTTYLAYCQNPALWSTATASQAPLVSITADVFGTSCVNPARHASGTSYSSLNRFLTGGCTTFGADTFAVSADSMLQTDFFSTDTTNSAAMTTTRLFSAYTASLGSGTMTLQGRYRIQTACSATCRSFRFGTAGTSSVTAYSAIYDSLVWLMKVTFWSAVATLVLAIYVQFSGQRTWRTPDHSGKVHLWYVYLAYWCILVTVIALWLLCQLWITLSPWSWFNFAVGYNTTQAQWATQVTAACVSDPSWASVFTQMASVTTLTSFTWYVQLFTVLTAVLLAWLLVVVYWVHYVLNKRRAYSEIDHHDVELGYQN